MPEQQKNAGDPQANNAGDPQANNAGDPQGGAGDGGQGDPSQPGDGGRDDLVDKLRKNEKQLLRQVEQMQAKLKEHDDAKLSETQKLSQRVSALEEENKGLKDQIATGALRDAARAVAAKAGAIRPDAVVRLVDLGEIQRDDDGNPTNLEELVEQVKKETPELFGPARPGSADAGARGNNNGGAASGDMNQLIRQAAGRP